MDAAAPSAPDARAATARIEAIAEALADAGLDGWLFYDFRGSDPIAASVLRLPRGRHATRRWYYYVPARGRGEPVAIVHAIEPGALDPLPGRRVVYLRWEEQARIVAETLAGASRVAMQYSPMGAIPYVSRVDAGTLERVRAAGVEPVSSADLVQRFEAVLDAEGRASHGRAAALLRQAKDATFSELGRRVGLGERPSEYEIQQFLMGWFEAHGLETDHAPIVARNEHAADPHYGPTAERSARIGRDELVLLDLWAKERAPGAIYADITWMAFTGARVPDEQAHVFGVAARGRDAGVEAVRAAIAAGTPPRGCDVDDVVRAEIERAGFGRWFIHRTGHSIGESVHGNGANLDNLETHDERRLIPSTVFSIEPGIYLPGKFGVRTEIDVLIAPAAAPGGPATVEVTGGAAQDRVTTLLAS